MSMPAIIKKDIYLFAGQIIYAVLYGVTSAAYVLLTTLVGLLSCGDIMIQGGRSCAVARVAPAEKFGLGRKF